MAVSLTQLSQGMDDQGRTACYPAETIYMPMPEDFQRTPQPSHFQQYNARPLAPPPPPQPQYSPRSIAQPDHQCRPYAQFHTETLPPPPPPRPAKSPRGMHVEESQPPPKPQRPHASSMASTIEPDPLPPHSNPQALSQTQSLAFEDSSPIPPVRIWKAEVWSPKTGLALYVITRDSMHMPSFLSTKPLLTVKRTSDGAPIGTIRFHTLSTSDITMTINGRQTALTHSGFVHDRWGFQATTCPNVDAKWYWSKDKLTGGAKLEDHKRNGITLAKMKGDLLTFETGELSKASYEEVLMSAIAMAEAARRDGKDKDIVDLAGAIGDFANSNGGGAGGDDGGKGGGGAV